jgi:hypothetical protein
MTNEPEKIEEETEEKTFAERVEESVTWVVNMMNEGKVNPKDVYPPNRYHGD